MLLIDVPHIPPEGIALDEELEAAALHLEGDREVSLRPGGRLRGHVELMEGTTVHVRGRLDGVVETDCARCLDRYPVTLEEELDLFFLPRDAGQPAEQEEEVELDDRDVVVGYYDGDRLDLGEVLREQVLLGLPLKPLCRDECLGLCPTCGRNRNRSDCGCAPAEEPVDPRLEPLRRLIPKNRK